MFNIVLWYGLPQSYIVKQFATIPKDLPQPCLYWLTVGTFDSATGGTFQSDTDVNALGEERLQKIYNLADVYHSENIEKIATEFVEEAGIECSSFDITNVKFDVPTFWDMGKVYKRLIIKVSKDTPSEYIKTLVAVYNSWISERIDNYNSSFYYSSPDYIYQSYIYGEALDF